MSQRFLELATPDRPGLPLIIGKLYAEARAGRYGLRRFGQMWLADEPEDIDTICKAPDSFNKDYGYVEALGRSRFSTDGREWQIRRDITQPRYVEAARPANRGEVAETYAEHLEACDGADPRAIRDAVLAASLTVFHRALGADIPIADAVELANAMREIARVLQSISLFGALPPVRQNAISSAKALLARVEARARLPGPLMDLLAEFAQRGEGLAGFAPTEEYVMNLFAGVETSVATICWVVDRLGLHGALHEELHEEVASGADDCPRVECFINETMRCFPPIPVLVRRLAEPVRLAGEDLPTDAHVLISMIGLHQNPRCWQRPTEFDPLRPEFRDGTYDRHAFLPFSTGARVCGGARLARMEVSEGVKAFLRRFRVRRAPGPVRIDFALAMRPDNWADLQIEQR